MKYTAHVTRMAGKYTQRFDKKKPVGKRPLRRSKSRWKDNNKMGLRNMIVGCELDLFGSGQVMDFRVPYNAG